MAALTQVRASTGLGVQPLPAGTRIGDAIMVVTSADDGGAIVRGGDQFFRTIAVTDMGINIKGGKFFLGKVNSLDPIEITTSGSRDGVRSRHALILTFTGQFNEARLTMVGANPDGPASFALPALPGRGSGAIVAVAGWGAVGGSSLHGVSGGGAKWNLDGRMVDASYHSVGAAWTGAAVVGSPIVTGTFDRVGAILIGVGAPALAAPPCRLIRDDDLGVGASRLYPPPRSQQRSIRGVGYY